MVKRKRSFRNNKPVKFVKYGNWCGPGWTAGKSMDAEDMKPSDYSVPAVNAIDQTCKDHDIAINEAETKEDVSDANEEFVTDARGNGYTGKAMGELVNWFGPGDVSKKKKDPHYPKSAEGKISNNFKIQKQMTQYTNERRRPGEIMGNIDMETTSRATNLSDRNGKTNKQGETAVTPMPTLKYLPFRQTEQVFMKYRRKNAWSVLAGDTSTSVFADTFRLNSIYDIQSVASFVQDPPAAIDTNNAPINTPHMRTYWMNFYKYWTVTNCHYRVKIYTTTASSTGELTAYFYIHGQQHPPIRGYLTDNRIEHFIRKEHGDMEYKKFKTRGGVLDDLNVLTNTMVHEGSYVPGSMTSTIAEDEFAETWHTALEVPSHRELLTIMIQRTERSEDIAYSGFYEIELAYEVQLKDLKCEHQYIAKDSGISAIPGYSNSAN